MRRELRVRILPCDRDSLLLPYILELPAQLRKLGVTAEFAQKNAGRAGYGGGPIGAVCEENPGRRFTGLPIAASCPRIAPAMVVAVRRLVDWVTAGS